MSSKNPRTGEVLVAVMNNLESWEIVKRQGWYRIPVDTAPRRFPPECVAFYFTKIFQKQAYAVRYWAEVDNVDEVGRSELFPDEEPGPKSSRRYFKLKLKTIQELPEPIPSFRLRRIVFIPTSLYKLETAEEINDLFDESPLEDALWSELKRLGIPAERQYYERYEGKWFALDFAVFCREGKIDIEADGDTWHADQKRIPEDNVRNNAMASLGWKVLRFNGSEIRERMAQYCVPEIVKTMKRLGGLDESKGPRRALIPTKSGVVQQLGLFEDSDGYPKRSE